MRHIADQGVLNSIVYNTAFNVGRVQSPTLAMLVRREAEIAGFVKEAFYTPILELSGFSASGGKLKDGAEAGRIAAACAGREVTVTGVQRAIRSVAPPRLYDLTTLQRDANRLLGYTAQQTLDYAQSLYEGKMLTYPRTDAKFITADMRGAVLEILGDVGFTPDIDRIIGAVSDHHAIIPTLESRAADIKSLPTGEGEIFALASGRLIAAVSPKHVYEAVTVTLDCGGNVFTAKGRVIIDAGWKTVGSADEAADEGYSHLPPLSEGQRFESAAVTVKEGFTKPKPHHTEDSILKAMETAGAEDKVNCPKGAREGGLGHMPDEAERKGLGTPATRAAILETLVKRGYVERVKKNLIPTERGRSLIAVLPAALTSAQLTAEWENKLLQVQKGELDGAAFMSGIAAFTKAIILDNAAPKPGFISLFPQGGPASPPLGACPRCGSPVREAGKGFFCDGGTCGFKLWKESKFWTAKKKPLTARIVSALLKNGRAEISGLHSERTGKKYDAAVILSDTGDKFPGFKLEFNRGGREQK